MYLEENCYCPSWYYTWGRRKENEVIFTRTTMMIESHWSVIKSQYLRHNNRPMVDFVLYVLEECLMPTVKKDFDRLLYDVKKPAWQYTFTKEWRRASKATLIE